MSQSTDLTPADTLLIPATDPAATVGLFFTVAELREAMSPVGYMTPANEINAAAAQAAQLTANAAIPSSTLGQPLGPVQSDIANKVPLANLPASVIGSSHYLGAWNALTNTPTVTSSVAPAVSAPVGGYYIVSTAGTPTIDGVSVWNVGDWAIWNGAHWDKIGGQANPVTSVVGQIGAVSAPQISTALNLGTASLLNTNVATGVPTLDTSGNFSDQSVGVNLDAVATIAALYVYPFANLADRSRIHVANYSTSGDKGGDDFLWWAACTLVDDTAYTINPTGNTGNGRWIRQRTGPIDIIACGAQVGQDISAALNTANTIAYNQKIGIIVSAPPTGTSWILVNPVTITAPSIEGAVFSNGFGVQINFVPASIVDMQAAITIAGQCAYIRNIFGYGPDGVSAAVQSSYLGTWILTQAQFTATISGNTLTVTAMAPGSGPIVFGAQDTNSISGAGMAAAALGSVPILSFVNGTSGDVGVYTIGGDAQVVSTPITIYQTLLPTMAAIKPGTVFFNAATSCVFENCYSTNSKIGRLITGPNGHVRAIKCSFQGFLGTHFAVNTGDYKDYECDNVGCGFACYSGVAIAFDTRLYGGHVGYALFGWFQFYNGASINTFGNIQTFGTSLEAFGEAAIQSLTSTEGQGGAIWIYGVQTGTLISRYGTGTGLVPVPRTYFFQVLGSLYLFKCTSRNSGEGTFQSGTSGIAYIGDLPNVTGDLDLDAFNGAWTLGSPSGGNGADKRMARYERDFIRRSELGRQDNLQATGNLFQNPEQASSYKIAGGSSVTVTPLSTLLAGALSGFIVPRNLYEDCGNNPNVIVLTSTSIGFNTYLNVLAGLTWNVSRSLNFKCWYTSTATVGINLQNASGVNLFTSNSNPNGAFINISKNGMLLTDTALTSVASLNIGRNGNSSQVIYLIAPMLSFDTVKGYNPLSTSYARNGLYIGNEIAGIAANSAPEVLSFNSTPPAGVFPTGTIGLNIAATSSSNAMYSYLTSGWAAAAATPSTGQQIFTASGIYTPSSGMKYCEISAISPGGPGGGGAMGRTGTALSGGGGGGGGQLAFGRFTSTQIGASISVTLGSPGTPGAGANANGSGASGTNGTATYIGSSASPLLRAQPAGAGGGGQVGIVSIGGTSAGIISGGNAASTTQPTGGFAGGSGVTGGTSTAIDIGGGGGGSNYANSISGPGGAAFRFGGGGSGGSITAAGAAAAGGNQGQSSVQTAATGGANTGGNGTNGVNVDNQFSQGGSGGGANLSGTGGDGGAGALGAGGAGGGAGIGGGGDGGAGGPPIVIITEFF